MMQLQHEKDVFTEWAHLLSNKGFVAANQLFFKHIRDPELRKILNDFTDCLKEETLYLEKRLKGNGISLPPSFTEQFKTQNNPMFVRSVNETELRAHLSRNIASSLVITSKSLAKTTNEYTLLMYGHFHMKKAVLGARLLQLSKEKCWIDILTK